MATAKTKRVLVVFPITHYMHMAVVRGITDYAKEQGNWALQMNPDIPISSLRHLSGWHGNGMIVLAETKSEVSAVKAVGVPAVNLAGALGSTGLPRVTVDQEEVGRVAAEHLLACGLRQFAYYGISDRWYSQMRKQGFAKRLAKEGYPYLHLESPNHFSLRTPWYRWIESLERWLKTLQLPAGLMAVHDYAAAVVVDACLRLGRRVPDDVAVIGVGNDVATCEFSEVPLSSVARNTRAIGYQAAALLGRLMAGKPPPKEDMLVAPQGVVKRRSTDLFVVDDPIVKAAIQFIQTHAGVPLQVSDVGEAVSISQRSLDLRFKQYLNCTPHDYIRRVRVERAKELLAKGDQRKTQQIARACGFTGARQLRDVFRRITGVTPAEFRQSRVDT